MALAFLCATFANSGSYCLVINIGKFANTANTAEQEILGRRSYIQIGISADLGRKIAAVSTLWKVDIGKKSLLEEFFLIFGSS